MYLFFYLLLALSDLFSINCRTVFHSFYLERIVSNPDGYPTAVIRVARTNSTYADPDHRAFPGPTLRAKKGDTIVLEIHNKFEDQTTSVHFHGLHMQNNPWMDGVPGVTQQPILPMSKFTYRFKVDQTGTYWYHSHSGHQYTEGFLGAIILDYPEHEIDPVKERFNYTTENCIILQDWFHESAEALMTNYRGPYHSYKVQELNSTLNYNFTPNYPWRASSILMNGRGRYNCSAVNNSCVEFFGGPCKPKTQCLYQRDPFFGPCITNAHPPDEYECHPGNYTRIRLINGAANAPFKFWIDQHDLIVVARDGIETVPRTVKFVMIPVGQRLDLIVRCSEAPPKLKYHMFTTFAIPFLPQGANEPPIKLWASALLSYRGAAGEAQASFWPTDDDTTAGNEAFEYQFEPLVHRMAPPAIRRIVLQYSDTYHSNPGEPLEEWIINNVTHIMPSRPLLDAERTGKFPNSTIVVQPPGPEGNIRKTHILQLEYGQTYEFVVIGINGQQHPWHLHGYSLDFVGYGVLNQSVDFISSGKDHCNWPKLAAIREEKLQSLGPNTTDYATVLAVGDSFTVPRFGYSIFRVTMNNQGPWLFHCHVSWHHGIGMVMIMSVERDGLYPDILPSPDNSTLYHF